MGKAPAFQFYANDFMDATSTWEANACGLYVRCLCKQWTHGSIPADLRILARAIHCDRSELETCWPVLGPKFVDQGDGTLKNSRLEEVRERQTDISSKRSEAGKAGVIAKANAKANGQAKAKQRKVKVEGEVEIEVEQEGKERAREPEIIPAGVSVELWDGLKRWGQYRKEKGNKLTPTGRAALLKKCLALGDTRALAAIDHSIAQGWTGMYEPKEQQTNGPITEDSREQRRRMVVEANAKFYRERDAANGN